MNCQQLYNLARRNGACPIGLMNLKDYAVAKHTSLSELPASGYFLDALKDDYILWYSHACWGFDHLIDWGKTEEQKVANVKLVLGVDAPEGTFWGPSGWAVDELENQHDMDHVYKLVCEALARAFAED